MVHVCSVVTVTLKHTCTSSPLKAMDVGLVEGEFCIMKGDRVSEE